MTRKKGDSYQMMQRRQEALSKILEKFELEGKRPTDKEVLAKLREKKFKIDRHTLQRDKADLAVNNTFVQDIAAKTYSKTMEDCYEGVLYAEEVARSIINQKWTRSKTITVKDPDGNVTSTVVETEEIAEPYLRASEEIRKCKETIARMINGDSIKVSASMWSSQRKKDMEELRELRAKVEELHYKQNSNNDHHD